MRRRDKSLPIHCEDEEVELLVAASGGKPVEQRAVAREGKCVRGQCLSEEEAQGDLQSQNPGRNQSNVATVEGEKQSSLLWERLW